MSKFTIFTQGFKLSFGAIAYLSGILINSAVAEPQLLRTLTVTGNGTVEIPTNIAEVELGVEIRGKDPVRLQEEIARRTSNVVDLLRSKNVEKLKTTIIMLEPNYQQNNEVDSQETLIDYTGTNAVSFRVSTDEVGTLINETVEAGATRIDEIDFTTTPKAISDAKEKALREASVNARNQADVVLNNLSFTSNEIIKIEVDRAEISPSSSDTEFDREQIAAGTFVVTPVISGEQTVNASVTLQISY